MATFDNRITRKICGYFFLNIFISGFEVPVKKIKQLFFHHILYDNNKGIIPEVGLVPEAKPRDTNNQVVLFSLSILDREHILMARSVAESPNI